MYQVIPLEDDTVQQGYACLPVSAMGSNPFKKVPDLDLVNAAFPSPMSEEVINIPTMKRLVITELPPREKAVALINTYYSRVAWQCVAHQKR